MTRKDRGRFGGPPLRKIAEGPNSHRDQLPKINATIGMPRQKHVISVSDKSIAVYVSEQNESVDLTDKTLEELILIDCSFSQLVLERVVVNKLFM